MLSRIALVTAVVALAACGSSNSSPSPTSTAPFSATDIVVGTGATAATGNRITVNYAGFLYDSSKTEGKGTRFDSSSNYPFTLGVGQVIKGWDQGIVGMRVGGQRRLVIPPALAYGNQSPGSGIPANATLVFDVGLISIP